MNRTPARFAVACIASLALLTTACGTDTTGSATPGATTTTTTTTSSDSSAGGDFAALKPCDLLTSADVAELGLDHPGEADQVGDAETCDWSVSGNGGLVVGLRPEAGVEDLSYERDKATPVKIGKFDAIQVKAPRGATAVCDVLIPVSASASVQIGGNLKASSTDTAAACERARKAAELIAPKLP